MSTANIALDYDGYTDDETDMSWRGGHAIQRIQRRNRRASILAAEEEREADLLPDLGVFVERDLVGPNDF